MKLKIDIDIETLDEIFGVVLKQQYKYLSPTIGGVPMFSYDREENKKKVAELRKAFRLVGEYNGVKL